MKTSNKGILEICETEGIVPAPYYDSQRHLTFGVGHTANAGGLDPAEMSKKMPAKGSPEYDAAIMKAIGIFMTDLVRFEYRVNEHVKVPLKQHQFDALVSFDFNTGGVWYYSNRLKKNLNARLITEINNRNPEASEHFFGWVKPPELRKRRKAEKHLFDTGNYDANGTTIPIWGTDGRGNLTGIIDLITGDELLKLMGRQKDSTKAPAVAGGLVAAVTAALVAFKCSLPDWLISFLSLQCGG